MISKNEISNIYIEQIERFKVQFCTDILSSNSKLPKCGITVFCDMFTAQVDKKTIYCAALPETHTNKMHTLHIHASHIHILFKTSSRPKNLTHTQIN